MPDPNLTLREPKTVDASVAQSVLDEFFASGGLTVYANTVSPWRWLICAGQKNFQTTVISPETLFENPVAAEKSNIIEISPAKPQKQKKKPFEQSRLVQWLMRAAQQTTAIMPVSHYSRLAETEDVEAFLGLVNITQQDWDSLNALPSLTAAEIRCFEQSHNAALSDIESAFLPAKMELPQPLASFYIRYLTKARRDVEASLTIAQATHSTRLPRLMSDALAIGAFEGAGLEPLRHENTEYAHTAAQDTSPFIDAALKLAGQKLALPIDHASHLLRLNVQEINQLAAEIVEQHRLAPFAFLFKAKQLLIARSDVCRFPPLQRFATAVMERDLNSDDAWVQRMALAYTRLFEGKATEIADMPNQELPTKILRFSQQ